MIFEAYRAGAEDAYDIAFIHTKSWQKAYRGIYPDDFLDSLDVDKRRKMFEEKIANSQMHYCIFRVDGKPAGMASFGKSYDKNAPENAGELYCFYFHPDFWGTPFTHMAMLFCIEEFKKLGWKKIFLGVFTDNIRARRFYEKHGFVFERSEGDVTHFGISVDGVRYSRDL